MNNVSLHHCVTNLQVSAWTTDSQNIVFCPMCEVEHENNTWCQANFNNFGQGNG
jgi:hypothetical protein